MANIENQVKQLRVEIGRRVREAGQLREHADVLITDGDTDKGVDQSARAAAVERSIDVLRGKLQALLPGLVDERYRAAAPVIAEQVKKRLLALAEEAKRAAENFRAFFAGWDGLLDTGIGQSVATQLLGNFGGAIRSAATDRIYLIAIERRQVALQAVIDADAEKQRATLRERIRAAVDAVEAQEARTA